MKFNRCIASTVLTLVLLLTLTVFAGSSKALSVGPMGNGPATGWLEQHWINGQWIPDSWPRVSGDAMCQSFYGHDYEYPRWWAETWAHDRSRQYPNVPFYVIEMYIGNHYEWDAVCVHFHFI
jgi:hypothetical protein